MSRLSEPVLYRRVHQLVRLYKLEHFIETGTGPEMDGLRTAIALRLTLASCDINNAFVEKAQWMFGPEEIGGKLLLQTAESLDFLKDAFYWFKGPALFFLDAHFPEYPDYHNRPTTAPQWPLLSELEAIHDGKQGVGNDVILCDDMRVIEDLENPRWDPKEMQGSPLVQKASFKAYTDVFKATHNWTVWPEFEGVLCFTPRG